MATPTITINGKEITFNPKARIWRMVAEFQQKQKEIGRSDLIEEHCKFLADVYGVNADEVLDNFEIADVIPATLAVIEYVTGALTSKVGKKNETAAD